MNTTLQKPFSWAAAAGMVLLSMGTKAQVTDPPVAVAGSSVAAHSFTANWQAIPGATSYQLDVSTLPDFGTPSTPATLIISEYVEGSTGYKAIEIYNGTGADVSLGAYSLRRGISGPLSTIATAGTILPNNTAWVVAYNQGIAPDLAAVADYTTAFGMMNLDGNTAIYLRRTIPNTGGTTELVDVVGTTGQPFGVDVTLRRKFLANQPTLDYSADDWEAFPMDDITGLGSHAMSSVVPSFVPGYEDLTVNGRFQTVSGLDPETTYYYRVRAIGPDGTSVNSNVISVTTLEDYTTQIQASQCGTELSTIYSVVKAAPLSEATLYRFEVTDTETSEVQTLDRTRNYFTPTMLPVYHYDKTYSVRVMVQRNGVWMGYGPSCSISTPYVLGPGQAVTVIPSQCGGVLSTINTHIETTNLPNVTGYRFRVTNVSDPSAPNQVQIIDRNIHWFTLTMLPSYNYGATYTVEVAIRTVGDFSVYGSPCQVTAPSAPSLTNCGAVIDNAGTLIKTASKDHVSMYRFVLTNENNEVSVVDRQQNWFTFNQVPSYIPGGLYEVRVGVMTAGHYSALGSACSITAPASVARMAKKEVENKEEITFVAKAFPNPFSGSFSIDATASGESNFEIKVYDLTGRLVEDRVASQSELQTLTLGSNYPSGVYNVIMTKGENVKTFRVIKR